MKSLPRGVRQVLGFHHNRENSIVTKTSKTLAAIEKAAPIVSSPQLACSETSFGKPATEKKQPSCIRLTS